MTSQPAESDLRYGAGPKIPQQTRTAHGRRFGTTAELYDAVRPGYPADAIDAVLAEAADRQLDVCDLGAGTGLLSRDLLLDDRVAELTAVDPDEQLLARNPAQVRVGTAEAIPLPDASVDIVTAAQAWHWFDPQAAGAEIARVLRPGGRLAILNNQLDVRIPWVLRLARIMHAGDVYRPGWQPHLGHGFTTEPTQEHLFTTPVTIDTVVKLAATRSYWLRSNERTRSRVEANIRDYRAHEAGFDTTGTFELPYLCLVSISRLPTAD
ncbi:class I SAM-dependent methyltransferase [Brevibacterium sp. UBA7493]|uniref:class I SAM-dependent methyltransferase n=1 Tax=Brevibacterium sp. UBA7493 TaxID=1946121 RepID=UPI0025811C4E|nr:class I SAM-dependent methyltransferase [Brevibacterium sp. UBA7493]